MNSHFGAEEVDASESSKDTLNAMAILEESAATVQRRTPNRCGGVHLWPSRQHGYWRDVSFMFMMIHFIL